MPILTLLLSEPTGPDYQGLVDLVIYAPLILLGCFAVAYALKRYLITAKRKRVAGRILLGVLGYLLLFFFMTSL